MAFNWQTFKTRTLTAAVFVAVMLTGLLWNKWSFLVLFSIIHFGCWWEYFRLMEKIHNITFHKYIKLGFMLTGFAIMLWFCGTAYEINNYSLKNNFSFLVSIAGVVLLVIGVFQSKKIKLKLFSVIALGLIYISLSLALIIDLRTGRLLLPNDILVRFRSGIISSDEFLKTSLFETKGFYICLIVIFTMWINDTMAYIIGSLFGKTPLSKVSPKKTVEGTIGGIILSSVIIGFTAKYFIDDLFVKDLSLFVWIGLGLAAAIVGVLGDLLESKLKRMANVKDSGHIMPGHGGFLDRFDSMLLAIPAVWLFVYFFMR